MNKFEDPDVARRYAAHTTGRNVRTGQKLASLLGEEGFTGGRLLDAGCGPGQVAVTLAGAFPGSMVTGMDISRPMLDHARSYAKKKDIPVNFLEGDLMKMPFDDDSFDAVVTTHTLHEVGSPVMMLDEIERVLALGGILCLMDARRSWLRILFHWMGHTLSVEEARNALEASTLRHWKMRTNATGFTVIAR